MSYPVAYVGSLVSVGGQQGRVITGSPNHLVTGGGGGSFSPNDAEVTDMIGMETEQMTPAERRQYLNSKFGDGAADAFDRSQPPVTDPGGQTVNPPLVPSKQVSCSGVTDTTPDSTLISKYYTVANASSAVYQVSLQHEIPAVSAVGLSRSSTICNLKYVLTNSIDPLTDWVAANMQGTSFKIGSGFRNNTGSSDHNIGSAIDLHFFQKGARVSRATLREIALTILNTAKIPFTQFLLEYQGSGSEGWIHVANRQSGPSAMRVGYSMNGTTFNAGIPVSV
jgi:hypothetical protein